MKVVVAIDSFKGSLSSFELGQAIEVGVKRVYPEAEVIKVPIADGGEGTVASLVEGTKELKLPLNESIATTTFITPPIINIF